MCGGSTLMSDKTASNKNVKNETGFEKIEKAELKRIEISQLPKEIPNFKNSFESKDSVIKNGSQTGLKQACKKAVCKKTHFCPKSKTLPIIWV